MVSVQEAFSIIANTIQSLPPKRLPLIDCLDLIIAEDVIAPIDVPHFDNSAMDGYAIRYDDYVAQLPLTIINTVQAGSIANQGLQAGEAMRIFTGAPIPEGSDTVIQQEWCSVSDGRLLIDNGNVEQGSNIRKRGTQTLQGTVIASCGQKMNAGVLSYIATFGIDTLSVFPKPKVGIINTGNEIVPLGSTLQAGQIYESNGIALSLMLAELGIEALIVSTCVDDFEVIKSRVNQALQEVDLLITTGGISVGDYDFIKPVMDELGVTTCFYKVKQKPGKPLFFGTKEGKMILSLPGNPAAVFTCFHIYGKLIIGLLLGKGKMIKTIKAPLANDYKKKPGLTHFLKAKIESDKVTILDAQLSYQMNAFAAANALVMLAEDVESVSSGELVDCFLMGNAID